MKECKKVNVENLQKRHLYTNIQETHVLYTEKNGLCFKVGLSKFAEMRPRYVLPMSDMPTNVCVCSIHENVRLSIPTRKISSGLPSSGHELIEQVCCDRTTPLCMGTVSGEQCPQCKHVAAYYQSFEIECGQMISRKDGK